MIFSVLPLSLFTFKLVKLMHLYVSRVQGESAIRQWPLRLQVSRCLTRLALQFSKVLITKNEPFFRTPKQALQPHHAF